MMRAWRGMAQAYTMKYPRMVVESAESGMPAAVSVVNYVVVEVHAPLRSVPVGSVSFVDPHWISFSVVVSRAHMPPPHRASKHRCYVSLAQVREVPKDLLTVCATDGSNTADGLVPPPTAADTAVSARTHAVPLLRGCADKFWIAGLR